MSSQRAKNKTRDRSLRQAIRAPFIGRARCAGACIAQLYRRQIPRKALPYKGPTGAGRAISPRLPVCRARREAIGRTAYALRAFRKSLTLAYPSILQGSTNAIPILIAPPGHEIGSPRSRNIMPVCTAPDRVLYVPIFCQAENGSPSILERDHKAHLPTPIRFISHWLCIAFPFNC